MMPALSFMAMAAFLGMMLPAHAHTAASGWAYDMSCCSTQDCTAVPDGRVTAGPDGWQVSLQPGDHPFAPDGMSVVVPYADKRNRVSGDDLFHICIGRITRNILCVYAPPMGF